MSSYTQPFLLAPTGASTLLERLPLGNSANGQIDERWLQDALFRHPEALPVKEIDPHVGTLIPVCMEIETGSGPADLLYVTPSGQVLLVETKLWRNPEARRAVVAQILDYAKNLTAWTYDVLEEKARLAAGADKGYLLQCLRKRFPDADEAEFVDGVGRSLSAGDFLLIIVGDGIRYGAESLVTFLERYGHLRFGLALVEVAIYQLPSGDKLLQPRVLAKTEILQKTILVGPSGPVSLQAAAQAEDAATPNRAQRDWFMNFWGEFLAKLKLDDASLIPGEPAKSPNQFFPMPPGGGMAWISAFVAQSSRRGGVYLTFAKAYERAAEVADALEADREAIERELGTSLNWERIGDKTYIGVPNVTYSDLNTVDDRQRVTEYLADMTARMIQVLKPRLEAVTRAIGSIESGR